MEGGSHSVLRELDTEFVVPFDNQQVEVLAEEEAKLSNLHFVTRWW